MLTECASVDVRQLSEQVRVLTDEVQKTQGEFENEISYIQLVVLSKKR